MTARYSDVEVRASAEERRIEVACTVHNEGSRAWVPSSGFAVSYQILDPATGSLIEDGKRAAPEQPVPPGCSVPVRLSVLLPPEPGKYRIYVSPLVEHRAWFYQQGSPFLLLDAAVSGAGARLERRRVVRLSQVRIETLARSFWRALWFPVRSLVRHRSLIQSMVGRDIAGRYRGSYGGLFWTVIHPALLMATYYFVFGVVLRTRFDADLRPSSFVVYFLAGMLPWLAISEALGRSAGVILEHRAFVKKLVFPVEILPANLAVAGLVSEVFGMGIFAAGLLYFERPLSLSMAYLPLLVIPQILLTLGLCWFLAALGVFFRDIGQIIGFLLTLWFFVTPICYPEASLPAYWLWLFSQNPLYILVGGYRRILLEALAPDWVELGKLSALSIVVFVAGHAWFYKLRRSFADLL